MVNDTKVDAMFDKVSRSRDPAEVAKMLLDVYQYNDDQYQYIPRFA